jgi:crossover junction endodeoxyribonuclease RusA
MPQGSVGQGTSRDVCKVGSVTISLLMPWPPSLNRYYRTVQGRILVSKDGRDYRAQAVGAVREQIGCHKAIDGRVSVDIFAAPPDKRRRDLDNLLKGMLDALTHAGVWLDDSQVDRLMIERVPPTKGGWVEVVIKPYQG